MHILVSGAGIAGLAGALKLGADGHDVTVVERARHIRLDGTPVDIRGEAIRAVDKMGLLEKIRRRRLRMSESSQFVDGAGKPVARIAMAEFSDSDDDIEILREDLVRILADALPKAATIRFADSIQALTDCGPDVHVRFGSGRTGRYDLVLGAEELRSHGADHTVAFERYETRLRPHVTAAQQCVHRGRNHLLPDSWGAITARNNRLQIDERARGRDVAGSARPRFGQTAQ